MPHNPVLADGYARRILRSTYVCMVAMLGHQDIGARTTFGLVMKMYRNSTEGLGVLGPMVYIVETTKGLQSQTGARIEVEKGRAGECGT